MSPSSDDCDIFGRLLHPTESLSSPIVELESVSLTCISFTAPKSGLVIAFFLLFYCHLFFREFVIFLSFFTFIVNELYCYVCFCRTFFTLVGVFLGLYLCTLVHFLYVFLTTFLISLSLIFHSIVYLNDPTLLELVGNLL